MFVISKKSSVLLLCLFGSICAMDNTKDKNDVLYGFSCRSGRFYKKINTNNKESIKAIMEDFGTRGKDVFGVFDGHIDAFGSALSAHTFQSVYNYVKGDTVPEKLKNSFTLLDAQIRAIFHSGTTAVVSVIEDKQLYIAHCGDSRAVVANTDGSIAFETVDHKPQNSEEQERIKKAGGNVAVLHWPNKTVYRVCQKECRFCKEKKKHTGGSGFGLSRALGDCMCDEKVLSAVPDITCIPRTNKLDFIILATDGVWDVINSQEAVICVAKQLKAPSSQEKIDIPNEIAKECGNSSKAMDAARKLRDLAYKKNSHDNITALVVLLKQQKEEKK